MIMFFFKIKTYNNNSQLLIILHKILSKIKIFKDTKHKSDNFNKITNPC